MYQVLFLGHGNLAGELLHAAELILGEQPPNAVRAIALLPGQDMGAYQTAVEQFLVDAKNKGGALIFTDLAGGSPFITAARVYRDYSPQMPLEIITGVNLPMAVEVLSGRESATVAEGSCTAMSEGMAGIRAFSAALGAENGCEK